MEEDLMIELLTSYGYWGILLLIVAINLLPFASPSNLVIAGAVVYFTSINPAPVALMVAVGATSAKLVHFYLAAVLGRRFNYSNNKLSKYNRMVGQWGALGAFIAAVSPVPDDPVVIPLGLMRYDSLKFTISYFFGKLVIALVGAYGTRAAALKLETLFGTGASIVGSAIISILVVTVLLKTDPSKYREYILKLRKRFGKSQVVDVNEETY
jgi:membrane protein DedA with SNARE-associated domain